MGQLLCEGYWGRENGGRQGQEEEGRKCWRGQGCGTCVWGRQGILLLCAWVGSCLVQLCLRCLGCTGACSTVFAQRVQGAKVVCTACAGSRDLRQHSRQGKVRRAGGADVAYWITSGTHLPSDMLCLISAMLLWKGDSMEAPTMPSEK